MPKVSVYLPDDLYREARERNLPLSALTQDAVERAIRTAGLSEWIADMRTVPRRTSSQTSISDVMDDVRGDFGT